MDSTNRGIPDGTENDSNQQPTSSSVSATPTASDQQSQQQTTKIAWEPNKFYLQNLIGMGISTMAAKKALLHTMNNSTEAAIEWIFENQSANLETPFNLDLELNRNPKLAAELGAAGGLLRLNQQAVDNEDEDDDDDDEEGGDDDLYKMVFIVNAELSMGVGKIAAQVAHAALGLHRILLQHQTKYGESLLAWTEYGETKIVLRGESTEHLINLESQAINGNLPCYLVHDAGRTQVQAGSTTVLSIFGSTKRVDRVTGSLKLY